MRGGSGRSIRAKVPLAREGARRAWRGGPPPAPRPRRPSRGRPARRRRAARPRPPRAPARRPPPRSIAATSSSCPTPYCGRPPPQRATTVSVGSASSPSSAARSDRTAATSSSSSRFSAVVSPKRPIEARSTSAAPGRQVRPLHRRHRHRLDRPRRPVRAALPRPDEHPGALAEVGPGRHGEGDDGAGGQLDARGRPGGVRGDVGEQAPQARGGHGEHHRVGVVDLLARRPRHGDAPAVGGAGEAGDRPRHPHLGAGGDGERGRQVGEPGAQGAEDRGGRGALGRRGGQGVRGGGAQRGGAPVERGGERGHGRPHPERVRAPRVDAAEQRVDEPVGHLVAEARPHQPAHRVVPVPRDRPQRVLRVEGGAPGPGEQVGDGGRVGGHTHDGAPRHGVGRPARADRRRGRRRVDDLVGQTELGQARGGLGAAGEEGLGADVDAHAVEVDRGELAAEHAGRLQDGDRRRVPEEGPQAVRRGEPADPAADDDHARRPARGRVRRAHRSVPVTGPAGRAPGRRRGRARRDRSRAARRARGS